MRAKLICTLAVLALTVALCAVSMAFIARCMDQADEMCSRAVLQMESGDTRAALETMTALAEKWDGWESLLEMVANHEDVHEVTHRILDTRLCLERGDDDFHRQAAQLSHAIQHIWDGEAIRLRNIL